MSDYEHVTTLDRQEEERERKAAVREILMFTILLSVGVFWMDGRRLKHVLYL